MPFKKDDPNINRSGRISKKDSNKISRRQQKLLELESLLRKLKPHVSKAIVTAAEIMGNSNTTETSKLKACTIILDAYKSVAVELGKDNTDDDELVDASNTEAAPVFSLVMPKDTE